MGAMRENLRTEYKVYVGGLGPKPPRRETLEDEFAWYGPLANVWVARSPPGFAYIEYKNKNDAHAAMKEMDGKYVAGRQVKCEMAKPLEEQKRSIQGPRSRSRGRDGSRDRSRTRSRSRSRGRSYSRSESRTPSRSPSR